MGMEQNRSEVYAKEWQETRREIPLRGAGMKSVVMEAAAGSSSPDAVIVAEAPAADMVPMDPERNPDIAARPSFWADNRGVGVVEMILILVVLIALVIIFKTQLTSLVKTIFNTITKNANTVLK